MAQGPIFSADSYTMEPADLWIQRMDHTWRDRAPRVINNYEGKKGSVWHCHHRRPGAAVVGLGG